MIGTVIRRSSTTETTAGGGTRSAPTRVEQPEIVAEAKVAPRAIQHRVIGLICPIGSMVPLLIRRIRSDGGVGRPTAFHPISDISRVIIHTPRPSERRG